MRCQYCGYLDSRVIDSRPTEEGTSIRRRRECMRCGRRFTTYEKIETTVVMVVKKGMRREPFSAEKIKNGLIHACQKRPVSMADIDAIEEKVEKAVYGSGENEFSSRRIGELVMEELKKLDEVAYVRFASVLPPVYGCQQLHGGAQQARQREQAKGAGGGKPLRPPPAPVCYVSLPSAPRPRKARKRWLCGAARLSGRRPGFCIPAAYVLYFERSTTAAKGGFRMSAQPESVLLVDGHSLIHRAFHALPLLSADGAYTNAVQGFFAMLFKAIADYRPKALCVMFDMHAPTFRHMMYDQYKAGRKPTPEELRPQFPIVREILTAMGVPLCEMEGYEADDLLGTAAKLANERGIHAYILTGDRDSLQLVSADTQVILTKTGIPKACCFRRTR
jgi:transcriptional regulator NrdR